MKKRTGMMFVKAVRSPFDFFKARPPAEPSPAGEHDVADWSKECLAFFQYWTSLKEGGKVPTSEAFLDSSSPRFAPTSFILELVDGAPVVRLQGTQLEQIWARDLTGEDFFPGRSQNFRAAGAANIASVLQHPCGHLARSTYASSKGRKLVSDWIFLPLTVREGRAPRVVGAVSHHGDRNFAETTVQHFELHKLAWLDAGWGVPPHPPRPLEN